jgi:hypothetical protein
MMMVKGMVSLAPLTAKAPRASRSAQGAPVKWIDERIDAG